VLQITILKFYLCYLRDTLYKAGFFSGVLGTYITSLEMKARPPESEKIIMSP